MLGDTVEIKMEWDPDELWVVSAVIMAGLILSPQQEGHEWMQLIDKAVHVASMLRVRCEEVCGDREEVAGDGEGRGVDPGGGGGAAPVV